MDSLDFLLEGFIDQTVLLYHWDPFKRRARNGNCVKRPTASYTKSHIRPQCGYMNDAERVGMVCTRNVLHEQLGGLEVLRELVVDGLFALVTFGR